MLPVAKVFRTALHCKCFLSISFAEQLGETDETELALAIPSNIISFASSSETEIRLFDYLTLLNCLNLQLPKSPTTRLTNYLAL